MNKNVVLAVMKRDLRSWFGNPTGYVFIMLFVAVSAGVMMWSQQFFANNLANLETWNNWFPEIVAVFVAAATMSTWTSERANGTQELLFTLPARDADLLAGKFLAFVGVYTVSLLFTLGLPIALMLLGNPDFGQLFANYVGYWLLGVMLVSVSMVGSQLTQNQTVAFILSVIACAAVVYLGKVLGWLSFSSWNTNGTIGQFNEFARGMLPLSGALLFVGLTVAFLYLNLALLKRRHWRGGIEGVHGILQSVGIGVATLALTVIGVYQLPRIDATVEGIHSLGEESQQLLSSLDPDNPILVTAYISEEVPERFVRQRRVLLNLLDQFDAIGGNAVQKSIIIPEPFSEEARRAQDNYGIRAQTVAEMQPGGNYTEMLVVLGLVVNRGTEEVITPFIEPGLPLEYEITRSIRVVSNADRKKVGLLKTDVDMVGGFDFQTFAQKPKWQIANELEQQYRVENVDPDSEYPEDIHCLVVAQPSSLAQPQMDRLQGWIAAGHPVILFEDPLPLSAPGTAADDQKGSMQQRMMGGSAPQKGNVDALFDSMGLRLHKTDIVWDDSSIGFFNGQLEKFYLFCTGSALSPDSVITSGMQSVVWMAGGHFSDAKREGFTVEPLVTSPDPTMAGRQNGIIPKYESAQGLQDGLLVWNPFGGGGLQPNPGSRPRVRNERIDLAVRVSSQPAGDLPGVNVIACGDLDAVGNGFFDMRRQSADDVARFDNVTFVLNCIDSLVGDESLIALRKRRPILRRLTAVEEAQAEFERSWAEEKGKAEDEAKAALDEAQGRLNDAVAAIRDDPGLDQQSKDRKIVEIQQVENRKFERAKSRIEDDKRTRINIAQATRNDARKGIHDGYRLWTILLAPVPALLLGIVTLFRRSSRAASIVPKNRLVGGGAQ